MQQYKLNAALLRAAKENDADMAFKMLALGANSLAKDKHGDTATYLFAAHGNEKAVLELAKTQPAASTLRHIDSNRDTPAILLAMGGSTTVLVSLAYLSPDILEDVNDSGESVASWLATYGQEGLIMKLAEINPKIKEQAIIMAEAIKQCNTGLIKALIMNGFAQPHSINERLDKAYSAL